MLVLIPFSLPVLHFINWGNIIFWKWTTACCTRLKHSQGLVLHSCPVQPQHRMLSLAPFVFCYGENYISAYLPHINWDREAKNLFFSNLQPFSVFCKINTCRYIDTYWSLQESAFQKRNKMKHDSTFPVLKESEEEKTSLEPCFFDTYRD